MKKSGILSFADGSGRFFGCEPGSLQSFQSQIRANSSRVSRKSRSFLILNFLVTSALNLLGRCLDFAWTLLEFVSATEVPTQYCLLLKTHQLDCDYDTFRSH